jgi:hypothetical protein
MTDDNDTSDVHPKDMDGPPYGWGNRTIQSKPHQRQPQYYETDAEEARKRYRMGKFDPSNFEGIETCHPDLLVHERGRARLTDRVGGTNVLIKGEKGSGKSTLQASLAIRVMEQHRFTPDRLPDDVAADVDDDLDLDNANLAIWSGSSSRSEWLRLKDYTTLWLPAGVEVEATWMNEGAGPSESGSDPADLEEVVRHVERYDGVYDLLEQLEEWKAGTFHVVYPDPEFRDCEEIVAESDRVAEPIPFTPEPDADPDESRPATPLTYWWVPFATARVESGPFQWMTWFYDEMHHLFEANARQDDHRTYDLVRLFRDLMDDTRRALFSAFASIHREDKLHHLVAKEFDWRIHMPDGSPNPHMGRTSLLPPGFSSVPMRGDLMSEMSIGVGLCYQQNRRTWFRWSDVPFNEEDEQRWLRIRLTPEEREDEEVDVADADLLEAPEYDGRIFSEWQNAHAHRLMVKDPGAGQVSVDAAAVLDEFESPIAGLEFLDEPLQWTETCVEVVAERVEAALAEDGEPEEVVLAQLPLPERDADGAPEGVASGD